MNIVTGQVLTHSSVNVDNAPELGEQQMEEFERGLPDSFHENKHRRVTTMAVSQKHIKVNDMKMFDTEMIYARAMALQCSVRNYDTKNLMAHELSPRPASMFDDSGAMKVSKTKSVLNNDLKVEVARRQQLMLHSWTDVQCCGSCHGQQEELFRTFWTTSDVTSKVIWNPVMCT